MLRMASKCMAEIIIVDRIIDHWEYSLCLCQVSSAHRIPIVLTLHILQTPIVIVTGCMCFFEEKKIGFHF